MAAEGGSKVIKYLMFFFNFIFFVCGLVVIIGGALVLTQYSEYVDFTGSMGNAIPIILIIIGVFILMTGFLGCCGAIKENYCMICTYAFIIVVILLLELGGGIAGYVLRDDIEDVVRKNMADLMPNYTSNNNTKNVFDKMQEELKCCGTNNYTDWAGILPTGNVPDSCCKKETAGCGTSFKTDDINQEGCVDLLNKLLVDNIFLIAGIAVAVAVIQIFGVVCSCCLMKAIKSEYEVV
ncbi:CD63 antigen-like [Asterias amurensis]|uniref:CD63 antigen-like n=1 Tax=Asterias amurensis TaxID=7602 RepID=UPI003AB1FBD7